MYLSLQLQNNSKLRLLAVLTVAIVVSVFIFNLMQMLINGNASAPKSFLPNAMIDFVRINPEQESRTKQREHRTQKTVSSPVYPQKPASSVKSFNVSKQQFALVTPQSSNIAFNIPSSPFLGVVEQDVGTTSLVAISKIAPRYPRNAARKGIEGKVNLEFTVLPDGSVADVKVIDSSPRRVFDSAAIAALLKWKFKPLDEKTSKSKRFSQEIEFKLQ